MKKLSKKEQELRAIIREQVLAELSKHSQRVYLNSSENAKRLDCHNQRILRLEKLTNDQRIKRISYCSHDDKLKSLVYLETTGTFLALKYKCEICGREYAKPYWLFSRKEKKALRKLGVNIK